MPTPSTPATRGPLNRLDALLVSAAALYDDWVVAETEAAFALQAWHNAPPGTKAQAHGAYLAALDREARAAEALEARLSPA